VFHSAEEKKKEKNQVGRRPRNDGGGLRGKEGRKRGEGMQGKKEKKERSWQ